MNEIATFVLGLLLGAVVVGLLFARYVLRRDDLDRSLATEMRRVNDDMDRTLADSRAFREARGL